MGSILGNDTKLGTSKFQQSNKEAVQLASRSIANSVRETRDVYMASPFGNDTKVGSSKFQKANEEAFVLAQRSASRASRAANSVSKSSPFGNDTKVGTSAFQQANKRIVQTAQQHTPSVLQQAKAAYIRQVQNAAEAAKNPTRNTKIDVGA